MTRFLCIRRGALGDTLWMIPTLRAMRARDPAAELHLAGEAQFAALLQGYGVVDRSFSSEDLALWSVNSDSVTGERARARLAGYDWIVSDQAGPELVPGLAASVQCFDPRPLPGEGPAPAQLLARLGLLDPGVDPAPRLRRQRPVDVRGGGVVLHPGSGSLDKCWPWRHWVELAEHLVRAGRDVEVALGEAEVDRADLDAAALPSAVDVLECRPLVELARRIERAACLVGHDSGVTHLAAALSVPTVAVFGPTDPAVCAPQGEHVTVVGERTPGPPEVDVAAVVAALS